MSNDLTTIDNDNQGLEIIQPLPLDRNPAAVYLASLSPGSRATMRQALNVIAGILTGNPDAISLNWAGLRYQHAQAVRSVLAEQYAPATASKMLCAMRRTMREAFKLELIPAEDYQRIQLVEGIKGSTVLSGRAISAGELADLMRVCEADPSPAGARDAALIGCLYPGGLRRAEVVGLDLENYDRENKTLKLTKAKRNKQRSAYLDNGAGRAMDDWLELRGGEPGPLFWPITKGGKLIPRRLTTQAVFNLLKKRGEQAGLADFSPHDLRRSVASDLLSRGEDLSIVAGILGHESTDTTRRYDLRPEEAKKKAVEKLHLPYKGRRR